MRPSFRFFLPPIVVLLFCCAWTVSVCAVEKNSSYQAALDSIRADDLGEQVEQLADPSMEGREGGTRGGLAAADYLAEQYSKRHLRGMGTDGKFLQPFAPNFRNVLAFLEGSDPKLRDQVVVVGAHYDHIGYGGRGYSLGPYGYLHPGADDNASGASAVVELAEAFTILSTPPKRSILFANWDAEEKGMLGSKHWVAHPTVPLERVIAAINLDMIGRLRDGHLMVFGTRSGYGWRRLVSSQNDGDALRLDFLWTLKPNADHYPFFNQGIPVLMVHTGLHDEYHRPSDAAKLINRPGMTQVTRLLFGILYELADQPEVLRYREAARHETPEVEKNLFGSPSKPVDRLGVEWIEDAALVGGVRVSTLATDSPADRAGVRVGDCIVRFAGREIRTDDDFFAAVSAAESPTQVTLKRPGEKKPLELKVELAGNPMRWGILWRVDEAEPGVIILAHVVPGSLAAQAGLCVGDRIYRVGGRDFSDEAVFSQLAKTQPLPLQLLVEREGRLRTVILQIPRVEPAKRAA